jgi:glycosyltransferase involved in cell wall biosynthesis
MKILYIAPYYSEDVRRILNLTAEFSPGGLNKIKPMISLLSRDYQVTLLSTGYSKSANFRWIRRRTERIHLSGRQIPVIYPSYPALRFFSFLGIAGSLLVECFRQRPPETLGPAWLAKICLGARIICQFEDGLHVLFGRLSPRRWIFRMIYELGKRLSDGLTLVNSDTLAEFTGKPAVVIPFVLPDKDAGRPGLVSHPLKERSPVRVAYTGTLDRERGADIFIEAARRLESNSRLQFYVAGRGPLLSWIREQAGRLKNLTFMGLLSAGEVDASLKSMDILVNPQRLSHSFAGFSFPSKVMRYILLNKPIVSTAFSDISNVPAPGLHFFHGDDPADLARVVVELSEAKIEVDYRDLYEKFSEEKMRRALGEVIQRICP